MTMKLPDDAIFKQFTRHDEEDFDGLQAVIAKRLRDGIDRAGAKWIADLFDPHSNFPFKAVVSRCQGYTIKRENGTLEDFRLFEDAYYLEDRDIDRAREKVQRLKRYGGHKWCRTKAYRIAKEFREYLDAIGD
jgi:hypothetical protein